MGVIHRVGLLRKQRKNDGEKNPEKTSNMRRGSGKEQLCRIKYGCKRGLGWEQGATVWSQLQV